MTESRFSEEIRRLLDRQMDAWNQGDAAAYAEAASEEIWFTNILGQTRTGRREFLERHAEIFAGIFRGSRLEQETMRLRLLAPDVAMVESAVRLTGFRALPPGIAPAPDGALHTRLLQVLVRQEGRWRVAAYHNVAVSPAAQRP